MMAMRLRLHTNDSTGWTVDEDKDDIVLASKERSTRYETIKSTNDMGDAREYRDVWYRRFLKHLSPHRSLSLHQSFLHRVLRPVGIPVEEVQGLHELFQPSFVHYSPLMGMIYTYNNFIDNLYRYGDPVEEPAVVLVQSLFHVLPGGEIQTTHLGSSAGAHVTPSLVGKILERLETLRPGLVRLKRDTGKLYLGKDILDLMTNDSEYQASRDSLLDDVHSAELHLASLHVRNAQSKTIRDQIKELEGVVVKRGKHAVKRFENRLKTAAGVAARENIEAEMTAQQEAIDKATKQIEELRSHIVTSLDFKTAKKALRRAQDMIALEEKSRSQLAKALVDCVYAYDPVLYETPRTLPLYTTSTILLAFMWRKYDSIHYLKGYMESMSRIGAFRPMMWSVKDEFDAKSLTSLPTSVDASKSLRRHTDWSAQEKATAAIISISKPGIARRPPVVQFSYVRWADYSEFPDCGETALRNLFNQLLYNPETGAFDHELLLELRKHFYPCMHQALIDFFQSYSNPNDVADHSISKAWIDVVSGLNTPTSRGSHVRYRREKQQQNIASPLSNVLCVVSALLGVATPDDVALKTLVDHINQVRSWNLQVNTSGLKADGFGIVGLTVGNVRYELQSYKPVHFGFVQADSAAGRERCTTSTSRFDYDVFRRLFQFSNGTVHNKWINESEKLALVSLFVPYMFQTKQTPGGFLDESYPPQFRLLFADLYQSPSQEAVIQWAQREYPKNASLAGYIDRIQSYQEPTFLPPSKSNSQLE